MVQIDTTIRKGMMAISILVSATIRWRLVVVDDAGYVVHGLGV